MPHVLSPMLRSPDERWQLVNETRQSVLATRLEAAFDSRTRRSGLLGRDALPPGDALIIAPCNAVHTCAMRFPIDVIFVDRAGLVLRAKSPVRPWRMTAAWRGFAVIELPAGTITSTRTSAGDRLAVVPLTSLGPV